MTGQWPIEIDHRDRNGLNDKWRNLRSATRAQNEANKALRKTNKTGAIGVHFVRRKKGGGKFVASIYRGKKVHLGYFKTLKEACAARTKAARKVDGEFLIASGAFLSKRNAAISKTIEVPA